MGVCIQDNIKCEQTNNTNRNDDLSVGGHGAE